MNGKTLVVKALQEQGVKYVFGHTGGSMMPKPDDMIKTRSMPEKTAQKSGEEK